MPMTDSIQQQLEWATKSLYSISCSAGLDSEVLLAHCLQKDRSYLLTWPERELTPQQLSCFHALVRRRLQPQPVAYLVGHREFYSMQFTTTSATLVPRPETELLVDTLLELLAHPAIDKMSPKVLELGTGTGAIALALKQHAPHVDIVATDISPSALEVAAGNALDHQLKISFIESSWFQRIAPERFDIIASNPPYIAASDPYLSQGDLPAEPIQALSSGETGLEALAEIIDGSSAYLKPGGWIVLEHGYDQEAAVSGLLAESGFQQITTLRDFNDQPRLTLATK